jgi:hypothetical protein
LYIEKTTTVGELKELFNYHGLRNGQDYVFLKLDNGQELPVMFANEEDVSFFMLAYECQKI